MPARRGRVLGRPLKALTFTVAVIVLVIGGGAIQSLVSDVRNQIERLASANSDSAQWTMAQADVELLAMIIEVQKALATPESDLVALRRRHDIFYGRIQMMDKSRFFVALRNDEEYARGMQQILQFTAVITPLVDGEDMQLRAALPEVLARSEDLRPLLRFVTLSGQRVLAEESDLRREMAADTLRSIGLTALALVGVLVVMVAVLAHLVRQARWNAARQAQSQERLKAIIAASLDAILVVDDRDRIIDCNSAAEQLFGHDLAALIGHNTAALVIASQIADGPRRGLPRSGGRFSRVDGLRRDGSRFPAECAVAEAPGEDGSIRICFLHDISDRMEAELALVKARDRALAGEKAKADMLAVMSHEMRTPLNGILGTLDLMQDSRLTRRQRDYLGIIRSSGEQLLSHVNDVLDVSRLDAGKMSVVKRVFDATALAAEVAANQRPSAEAQGNRLEVRSSGQDLDHVLGDAQKLGQVLINLVGNAVKFTKGGSVTLEAERLEGDLVEFRVIDTGIGIPPGDLERIFEEFVTLDASYGRITEGSGLGLAISRKLVQTMGGTLAAESRPGTGSLFRVTLPLPAVAPALPATAVARPDIPAAWRPLSVLVVEDNPINRFVVRAMLEGDGHLVNEASNGAAGLRLASDQRFDLILMDIAMPELDGALATRAIRQTDGPNRETPIIALTAHALPADISRFERAGVTATVTKPLSRQDLRAVLADAAGPRPAEGLTDPSQTAALAKTLGADGHAQLLGRFVQEIEEGLAHLTDEASDAQDRADLAHKLAGSAAIFGATALREALVGLERAARSERAEDCATATAAATAVWPASRAALEAESEKERGAATGA